MSRGNRVEVVIAGIDKIAAPIRKINRQIETMLAPVRKVQRAFRSLAKEAHLDKLGRGLKSIGRATSRIALAGAAGVAGLGVAIERLASKGDSVAKLTRRLKFNAAAFQEYEFAAGRIGIGADKFRAGVSKLNTGLGQLKAGKGPIATLLDAVDPKFASLLKRTTSTDEALALVIGKMRSFKDPAKRAALTAAFFGESAADMALFASSAAEEIEELRNRARELGIVMSDKTLKASEKLTDRLTDLKAVGFGLWQQIGGALMPTVSKLVKRLTDWTIANQALIRDKAIEYFDKLVVIVGDVYKWIVDTIPKVGDFIAGLGGVKGVTSDFVELVRNLNKVGRAIDKIRRVLPASQRWTVGPDNSQEAVETRMQTQVKSMRQFLGLESPEIIQFQQAQAGRGLAPVERAPTAVGGSAQFRFSLDRGLILQQIRNELTGVKLDVDRGMVLP